MNDCKRVNWRFDEMTDQVHKFFAKDDWERIVNKNYEDNKDVVDEQWAHSMRTWDAGIFFDAGMFYGRTWKILITGHVL